MANRLRLPWKKHSSGYEIIRIKPNLANFNRREKGGRKARTHGSIPTPKPILHGDDIQHGESKDPAQYQVIYPKGNKIEKFNPIENAPDLYLEFANTPRSIDDILKFATEYGLLEAGEDFETVDAWRYHIKRMSDAISNWDYVQDDRPEAFAETYRSLCPYSEDSLKHSLELGPSGTLCLYLEPVNLLAAMWVQFAGAIEGATSFGPCKECSAWINTDPRSNRPDKIYCSDACRMRSYRKRKSRKVKK